MVQRTAYRLEISTSPGPSWSGEKLVVVSGPRGLVTVGPGWGPYADRPGESGPGWLVRRPGRIECWSVREDAYTRAQLVTGGAS